MQIILTKDVADHKQFGLFKHRIINVLEDETGQAHKEDHFALVRNDLGTVVMVLADEFRVLENKTDVCSI